jgi:hypothetical protein
MKISIYAPYAKERFETARQHSILHPERIVGNPEVCAEQRAVQEQIAVRFRDNFFPQPHKWGSSPLSVNH